MRDYEARAAHEIAERERRECIRREDPTFVQPELPAIVRELQPVWRKVQPSDALHHARRARGVNNGKEHTR